MRAIIFNSGLGSRLGSLTANRPKCLVRLAYGETIFHRQLRVLCACGIRDFVITTGPFADLVEEETRPFAERGCTFTFVNNPRYAETNYLYSLWLAREELRGHDLLMLHGDLVFDAAYVQGLLEAPEPSLGSVNELLPLPDKDFKARLVDGEVREVGVGIFGDDCITFQALYKLSAASFGTWMDEVERFVERGETGVYAENAANVVFESMHVKAHSYAGHYVEEVDTPEDLARVSAGIVARDFADQPVYEAQGPRDLELVEGRTYGALTSHDTLGSLVGALGMRRPLVVVDAFFANKVGLLLDGTLGGCPTFSGYAPNPTYEQVLAGIEAYRAEGCDGLVSIGGGSATDVAKCIRLWAPLVGDGSNPHYAELPEQPVATVPHVAIPTTAGTGSESTHFAVVYVDGSKVSIAQETALPSAVILCPDLLAGLPDYQRKATFLDALCQAIESHWSARSSEESRSYSARAIPLLMENVDAYLAGDAQAATHVMRAANLAGKAINLTTTTAPHAMSYKLTSRYGIAHGHAVALCMAPCWQLLLARATAETQARLSEIDALVTGVKGADLGSGCTRFAALFESFALGSVAVENEAAYDELASSVNAQRLGNFPLALTHGELRELYVEALG